MGCGDLPRRVAPRVEYCTDERRQEGRTMRCTILVAVLMVACGEAECEEDAFSCDGQILVQCQGGEQVEVSDCDVEGGTCMASMGHCHMATMDSGTMQM